MTAVAVPVQPHTFRSTVRTWRGTLVRLGLGVIFGIDAYLKWLPGYRSSFISQLQQTAQGQPHWLHGWFHFWVSFDKTNPMLFATITGLAETGLALVLLLGVARRIGYAAGALYMLFVWAVGEGFGGPYQSGSTDVGTGIIYALLFAALLVLSPGARTDRLSLDGFLVRRIGWWRYVAEPHARDRAGDKLALGVDADNIPEAVQVVEV